MCGKDGGGGRGFGMRGEERLQRSNGEERNIAREQDDGPILPFQARPRLEQRVTRSELLLLRDELDLGPLREGMLDLVAAVSHDHRDAFRLQGGGGPENAFDERQAANLVQDLGQPGFHPRALTGGEDNDVYVGHARGIQTLILVRGGRLGSEAVNRHIGRLAYLLRSIIS